MNHKRWSPRNQAILPRSDGYCFGVNGRLGVQLDAAMLQLGRVPTVGVAESSMPVVGERCHV